MFLWINSLQAMMRLASRFVLACTLPHRQLRKTASARAYGCCLYTAAQAAQEREQMLRRGEKKYTAAQAAQEWWNQGFAVDWQYTAAQAAQEMLMRSAHGMRRYTAAQAAQKHTIAGVDVDCPVHCCIGSLEKMDRLKRVILLVHCRIGSLWKVAAQRGAGASSPWYSFRVERRRERRGQGKKGSSLTFQHHIILMLYLIYYMNGTPYDDFRFERNDND